MSVGYFRCNLTPRGYDLFNQHRIKNRHLWAKSENESHNQTRTKISVSVVFGFAQSVRRSLTADRKRSGRGTLRVKCLAQLEVGECLLRADFFRLLNCN